MTTRRRFLKAGAMIAVAGLPLSLNRLALGQRTAGAAAAGPGKLDLPWNSQLDPLFNLRKSSFSAYVNSIFQVKVRNGVFSRNVSLTLVEVADPRPFAKARKRARSEWQTAGLDSFSLLFRGSGRTALPQDVYDIEHPALGTVRVLLVPVFRKTGDAYYEVVVNRATS